MAKEKKAHPPSTKVVIFWTGEIRHNGFYVKDINKYVRNVHRWKDIDTGIWYEDDEVTDWKYLDHWVS